MSATSNSMYEIKHEGLTVQISKNLAEMGLMPSGLLQNEGQFKLVSSPPLGEAEIFSVSADGFSFRFATKDNAAIVERCGNVLEVEVLPFENENILILQWNYELLSLATISDRHKSPVQPPMPDDEKKIDQLSILVPQEIRRLAREASLLKIEAFNSIAQFSSTLMEDVRQAEARISETGAQHAFWDFHKCENPTPKREPKAVTVFSSYLLDRAILHGYEIIQEAKSGAGALDLLAIGKLATGRNVKIAIEGKKAHSTDVLHGLQNQLPTYMEKSRADRGVYLVLWFKSQHYQHPEMTREILNAYLTSRKRLQEIGVIIVDVSLPLAPSNPKHRYL